MAITIEFGTSCFNGGAGSKNASSLVRPEGFEPPTIRFEVCYSIQLSYGRMQYPILPLFRGGFKRHSFSSAAYISQTFCTMPYGETCLLRPQSPSGVEDSDQGDAYIRKDGLPHMR